MRVCPGCEIVEAAEEGEGGDECDTQYGKDEPGGNLEGRLAECGVYEFGVGIDIFVHDRYSSEIEIMRRAAVPSPNTGLSKFSGGLRDFAGIEFLQQFRAIVGNEVYEVVHLAVHHLYPGV